MLGSFYQDKRVLVSGHTGFKGAWLCQMLLGMGARVSGYALEPDTEPNLYSILKLEKRLTGHVGDIGRYEELLEQVQKQKPEIVIHMAAQPLVRTSYDDPIYTYQTNVMGTVHMLEAVRHCPSVRAAVMITTDKVYENPEDGHAFRENEPLGGYDPYSASKAADEIVISSYMRSFFNPKEKPAGPSSPIPLIASARAGNVIGGGDWSTDRLIPDIIRAKAAGRAVALRNPGSVRPWQHVLDPLYGYLLLGMRLHEGEGRVAGAYNFAPDEKQPITVEQIVRRAGAEYRVQPDPAKHEAHTLRLDAGKAKKELGWKPQLGIEEGLAWTLDWYARHAAGEDMESFTRAQIGQYLQRAEKK
ncbi:GDP-mannose 4,6-dehydratase [uncultured archaeon]|nr:GDP-mannose 4,6-dehydratase [uncultured archaeon]